MEKEDPRIERLREAAQVGPTRDQKPSSRSASSVIEKGETSARAAKTERPLKKRLPSWLPWLVIGVLGVVVLVMVLGGRGGKEPEPTEAAEESQVGLLNTAGLGIGSTMINAKDNAEMVYVPAGEFLMGSEDGGSDEDPEHTVYLDAYWIYKYEVTNEQYRSCIEAGECEGDLDRYPEDEYPARYIDWNEADAYCEWAGGRLPTEAEWEKTARGTDGRTYPWGEESPTCSLATYYGCEGDTSPVGSYPDGASPYGVLDMAGNVWEWVADRYDADYYSTSPARNPSGPENGTYRVIRGGSWYDHVRYLRASYRRRSKPVDAYSNYGFRCFRSP